MFYKVSFTIDTGCTYDEHIAIVSADSGIQAIRKVEKYVDPKLGYDEFMPNLGAKPIDNNDILYCDFKEEIKC